MDFRRYPLPAATSTYVVTLASTADYTEPELQAACEVAHAVDRGAFYLAPPRRP